MIPWCCHALAALAAFPVERCVDDMTGSERSQTIHSGWTLWRLFADLCGWRVRDATSPPPAQVITERRLQVLAAIPLTILEAGRLSSGQATRMWRKLQHATSMRWGNYGIAKLRAFIRRQREASTILNVQLLSVLRWWLRVLPINATPREIPHQLTNTASCASHSQRRGNCVGVAVRNNFENATGSICQSFTRCSYVLVAPLRTFRCNLSGY